MLLAVRASRSGRAAQRLPIFEKSGGGAVSAAFAANSLHPLFNSAADREGYRLSGQGRQLADNSFGFRVLDG